jgi:hypothetical protein
MTIICVIHQPRLDVFELFDSVLFLAPGGRTVFQGAVPDAEAYFDRLGYGLPRNANPADYYMDVISACNTGDPGTMNLEIKNLPEQWIAYETEQSNNDVVEHIASSAARPVRFKPRQTAGFFKQLWMFFVRSCVLQMRDLRSIILNIFLVFVSGSSKIYHFFESLNFFPLHFLHPNLHLGCTSHSIAPTLLISLCILVQRFVFVVFFR